MLLRNHTVTSHDIHKDILCACTLESSNAIIVELREWSMTILVNESRDVLIKEDMAIVLRYVDRRDQMVEWFFGLIHVIDTSAVTLKIAIEAMLTNVD